MAALKSALYSLGTDNLPVLFVLIGALMLSWIFFLGDMILPAIQ